jgi:hypothetical protein
VARAQNFYLEIYVVVKVNSIKSPSKCPIAPENVIVQVADGSWVKLH